MKRLSMVLALFCVVFIMVSCQSAERPEPLVPGDVVPEVTDPAQEEKPKITYSIEFLNLDYDDLNVTPKVQEMDIYGVHDQYVFATITDVQSYSTLLETESLVLFHLGENRTEILPYDGDERIYDYVVKDGQLYLVKIGLLDNQLVWELVQCDFQFQNQVTLETREYLDPFRSPVFIWDQDDLYLASTVSSGDGITEFALSEISDGQLIPRFTLKEDSFSVLNFANIRIQGSKAYYATESKESQTVYCADLSSGDVTPLKTVAETEGFLFGYLFNGDYLFASITNNQSTTIAVQRGLEEVSNIYSNVCGYEMPLMGEYVLTHNIDGSFSVFDRNAEEIFHFQQEDLSLMHKYFALNENTMILQDTKGCLYRLEFQIEE